MSKYAKSNWPKFGQNNYNLRRAIELTPQKPLPIDKILKILKENQEN